MTPGPPPPERRRRARTAFEILDEEERRASEALKGSVLAAAEDLCQVTDVRGVVRRHPVLALGVSAALGAALAPLLAEVLREQVSTDTMKKHAHGTLGTWLRRIAIRS